MRPATQAVGKRKTAAARRAAKATIKSSGKAIDPVKILRWLEERREQMVQSLRRLVERESPSDNKQAADHLSEFLAARFAEAGGKTKLHLQLEFGDHLQVDFPGASGRKPLLLLGHYDTVYPLGTLATMPCRLGDICVWGPGALDMKSGITIMLHAIQALRALGGGLPRPLTVLLVSDEEVGSNSSRQITENLAKKSAAVLVLEPSFGLHGALKTARKGVGDYTLKITGRAAHVGLDYEKGASAVLELVRQIIELEKLTDLQRGLTVSVGVVRGGTRSNVIPAEASAEIDVRIDRMGDGAEVDKKMRALRPFNPKCRLEISGGIGRPPMERTRSVTTLFTTAYGLARKLGWKLQEAAVGGGSDGNFTAALGVPTLDGLGGVGDGVHSKDEFVLISELPRRAALLASLIQTL